MVSLVHTVYELLFGFSPAVNAGSDPAIRRKIAPLSVNACLVCYLPQMKFLSQIRRKIAHIVYERLFCRL